MRETYIIAEAGVNHNGSLDLAKQLIDAAVEAGADAVKFQTFKTEKLVARSAPKAEYQARETGAEESQFEMIKRLELDEASHRVLIDHCRSRGIQFLSTPFDPDSVDLLAETFDLPRLKVPSGEITNAPLLLKMAQTGKPIILSTGMSTLGEVETALGVLAFGYLGWEQPAVESFQAAYATEEGRRALQENVTLLHCTTEYPTPYAEVNLRAIDVMREAFGLAVGYSDHTAGIAVSIGAAARGAVLIEKHFTLDRNLPGPDHKASLEPEELKAMVASIRQIEAALGRAVKVPVASELKNRSVARKSIVAARTIAKGELLTAENVAIKRPGTGKSPLLYWDLLGTRAERDYQEEEPI